MDSMTQGQNTAKYGITIHALTDLKTIRFCIIKQFIVITFQILTSDLLQSHYLRKPA